MNICITGSEGFVGANMFNHAIDRGHAVRPVDRRNPNLPIDIVDAGHYWADGCECIIHCAAHADVKDNWSSQIALQQIEYDNVSATLRALDAAACCKVKTFVFFSTGAVYAALRAVEARETSYCEATSPYAASKLAGEAYVRAFAEKYGWRWYIIRPSAIFGRFYTHGHIADFVRQLDMTGRIHALDAGTVKKQAISVDDVCGMTLSMIERNISSGIYNMASEERWGWRDTVRTMSRLSGTHIDVTSSVKETGWVGDGHGAVMNTSKLLYSGLSAMGSIETAVEASLKSLKWPR